MEKPSARAVDEEWLEWASRESGIRWNGNRPACSKLMAYVFRHRFPLFSGHETIEAAVDSGEWVFLAEYDRENCCACTNGISKNHLMRHVPTGEEVMIGSECFNRYFLKRRPAYSKERTERRKRIRTMKSDTGSMDEMTVGGRTFRDAFDTGHVAVSIARNPDLWHRILSLQAAARYVRFRSTYVAENASFKSKSAFAVLARTNAWQVNFCRNVYDDRSSTSDFARFKKFLEMQHTCDTAAEETFELDGTTHSMAAFQDECWPSTFPAYVMARDVLQEMDSSADRETRPHPCSSTVTSVSP